MSFDMTERAMSCSRRLYAYRVTGGDRHHCHPCRPAVAGLEPCGAQGADHRVHAQSAPDRRGCTGGYPSTCGRTSTSRKQWPTTTPAPMVSRPGTPSGWRSSTRSWPHAGCASGTRNNWPAGLKMTSRCRRSCDSPVSPVRPRIGIRPGPGGKEAASGHWCFEKLEICDERLIRLTRTINQTRI